LRPAAFPPRSSDACCETPQPAPKATKPDRCAAEGRESPREAGRRASRAVGKKVRATFGACPILPRTFACRRGPVRGRPMTSFTDSRLRPRHGPDDRRNRAPVRTDAPSETGSALAGGSFRRRGTAGCLLFLRP
jgi:hypothetical protein